MVSSARSDTSADATTNAATEPRVTPTKIPRGLVRRQEILAQAARILLRDGLNATSMDLIASEAGASKATLYRHFTDRHGMMAEAVQYLCRDFLSDIAPQAPDNADLRGKLRAILLELVRVVMKPKHPDFYRLVVDGASFAPEIGRAWYEHGPCLWYRLLNEAFQDEINRGHLPADLDYTGLPHMLFDAVFGDTIIRTAALYEQSDGDGQATDYLDTMLDLVMIRVAAAR